MSNSIIFNINNQIIHRNSVISDINNLQLNLFNADNLTNENIFSQLKWWKNIYNNYFNKLSLNNQIITKKWFNYLKSKSIEWKCSLCHSYNLGNKLSWGRTKCYICNNSSINNSYLCTKRYGNELDCDI